MAWEANVNHDAKKLYMADRIECFAVINEDDEMKIHTCFMSPAGMPSIPGDFLQYCDDTFEFTH